MPLTRNVGSGSYTGLQKFMGDNEIVIPEGETELVFGAMSGIIEAAADDVLYPGAIGYSYFIYASQIQANNNVKLIGVDGVHPSMETIGNNTYPITDSFYMVYNKKKVTTEMTQLMNWVLSSQGQELVKKTGYAPVNIV